MLNLDDVLDKSKAVGNTRGIYFLIKDRAILYIGQSPNYFRRLGEHLKTKDFTHYHLEPVDDSVSNEALTTLERIYIDKFNPPLNKQKNFWQNSISKDAEYLFKSKKAKAVNNAINRIKDAATAYAAAKAENISLSFLFLAMARVKQANQQ